MKYTPASTETPAGKKPRPKAGKVVELFAKEGTTVENNAKLVVVE